MDEKIESAKNISLICYCLYAAAILFGGLTSIVAIIINYVKQDDVKGTIYESHFRWQIRTFWFSVLWFSVGLITVFFGIGFVVWGVAAIWWIYRIVKGILYQTDGKAMYV